MKHIELNNYYDTLTEKQKLGHADKQGALFYYEWFDMLYEMCSFEESGCLLLTLLYYDRYGGNADLPAPLIEKLNSDRALKMLFTMCMDKIAAASREWINKHKLKATSEEPNNETTTNNEEDELF